jgi:hypothetical protein
MRSPRRRSVVARLALLAVVAVSSLSAVRSSTPAPAQGEQPSAGSLPEVRLRKLHLVRPDLIPYPIAFEVYC